MHHCKLKLKPGDSFLNDNNLVLISTKGMISGALLYFRCSRDTRKEKSDDIPSITNKVFDIYNRAIDPYNTDMENRCFVILQNAHLYSDSEEIIDYDHLIVFCEQINGMSFGSLY